MIREHSIIPGWDCIYGDCVPPCPGRMGINGRGNHGINDEKWHYAITADDHLTALTLRVSTDIYPTSVPEQHNEWCGVVCPNCDPSAVGEPIDPNLFYYGPSRPSSHYLHDGRPCTAYTRPGVKCSCTGRIMHDRRRGADLTFHIGFPTKPEQIALAPYATSTCVHIRSNFADCSDTSGLQADAFWMRSGNPLGPEQGDGFWDDLEALFISRDQQARASDMRLPSMGGKLSAAAQVVWDQLSIGEITVGELELILAMKRGLR